jgi:predicted MFS family arabinose efflux permease
MIAKVYAPDARPRVFAALSAAWVVPALIGPGVAGIVSDAFGWRWVFYGIVPLVVPALLMLLSALRQNPAGDPAGETGDETGGRRSRPLVMTLSAAGTAFGAGALLYGIDALHTKVVAGALSIVVGLVVLGLGLPRLLPRRSLSFGRGLPTTIMMRGLFSAAFFGVNSFIPLFLHDVRGFSTTLAGVALTTGALGWSTGSYLQSRRGFDRVLLVRAGAVAVTLGILITLLMVVPGVSGWVAVPAWIIAGLGMGLGITTVNVTALQQSPDAEQGANSAALQVMDTLFSSLSIGLGGALINLIGPDDLTMSFAAIAALMAVVSLFAVAVSGRMR